MSCHGPSCFLHVLLRRPLKMTGRKLKCLNLSSYNYLGFAAADEYCTPRVQEALDRCGWGACSSRADAGEQARACVCVCGGGGGVCVCVCVLGGGGTFARQLTCC